MSTNKDKEKLETSVTLRDLIKVTDLAEVISEHTKVSKKGKQLLALCPFHSDTKPSLQINISKQLYYCFPCQSGGNVVNFLAKINSWDLSQIRKWLAKRANIELKVESSAFVKEATSYTHAQQQTLEFYQKIATYFEQKLAVNLNSNLQLKDFLDKRGLDIKTIQEFNLGFAPHQKVEALLEANLTKKELITFGFLNSKEELHFQNRLLFPLHNISGDIVAFSGRSIDEQEPKYLNSPENAVFQKSQLLFNFNRCLDFGQKPKSIYLVEGIMDVISLWRAGFEKAVALLGSALSKQQLLLLQNIEVILGLDSDEAGMRATLKTIKLLLDANISLKIIKPFEEVKDIDEFAQQKGYSPLKEYIQKNTMSLADYLGFVFGQIIPQSSAELLLITSNLSLFIPFLKHVEIEWITNNLAKVYNIGQKTLLDTLYMPHQNLQNIEINNIRLSNLATPSRANLRRKTRQPRQFFTKKVTIKEIVNPNTKQLWNNKREIYELKILKALIESQELREYFNQNFFETQNYFLNPLHNQFLRIQNQIFDTHQTDQWSEELTQLELKINNTTHFPTTIEELKECILNTDNPNVKRLNLITQINNDENI